MEATQKQKGFIKSKLAMSFARVTKRTSQPQCSSKVTPSPPLATQKGLNQLSLQRVSYASSKPAATTTTFFQPNAYVTDASGKGSAKTTWGSYGCDENVDMKAADYISYVRERFDK
ncbi:hypothetical protein SLEP1_g57210 [Rubroshorea leprosula]|uniref:Uncharacterized protein n=1 Tax=Rubroshorea leprosula TaxID=152421 RepID=A0AAV5MLW7_9ROSI|nr:hypothetical protein SLEP1_g57210 [Rubroshorea leprosula]